MSIPTGRHNERHEVDPHRRRRAAPAAHHRQHPAHARRPARPVQLPGARPLAGPAHRAAADRRAVRHLPRAGPGPDLAGAADADRHARRLARRDADLLHADTARHLGAELVDLLPRGRLQPLHPRLRQRRPAPPLRDRLHRRLQRPPGDRPADRLPAHPLRRLQPPRTGGDPAPVPGRRARLGPGTARPAVPGGHRDRPPPALPGLGAPRRRPRREPLQLPGADLLPLPAAQPQLGGRTDRRHGRRRRPPGDLPAHRPARGPVGAPGRVHRAARHRALDAGRLRPRPGPGRRDPPQLHRVRRGRRPDRRRRVPARTAGPRGLAALPGVAGELRAAGLRAGPPQRRRPGAVERPARLPGPGHPPVSYTHL